MKKQPNTKYKEVMPEASTVSLFTFPERSRMENRVTSSLLLDAGRPFGRPPFAAFRRPSPAPLREAF